MGQNRLPSIRMPLERGGKTSREFATYLEQIKQDPASSPTYAGVKITGLTASVPVVTDANKNLVSKTYASFLSSLGLDNVENTAHSTDAHTMTIDGRDISADLNQAVRTGSSPSFVGLTLSGNISADTGTFTGLVTGIPPTLEAHFATKEYVDDSIGTTIDYYFNNTASGTDGKQTETTYVMDEIIYAGEEEISRADITAAPNQLLFVFDTLSGEPGSLNLIHGTYSAHIHVAITGAGARTVDVKWTLSHTDDNGDDETPIMTSETEVIAAGAGEQPYTIHAVLAVDVELASARRLLFKLIGDGNTGGDATMAFHVEGNTGTHMMIKAPAAILNTWYVRQDGSTALTGNWNVGGYNLTNVGTMTSKYIIVTPSAGPASISLTDFDTSKTWRVESDANNLEFIESGVSTQVYIKAGGKVGLKDANPAQLLSLLETVTGATTGPFIRFDRNDTGIATGEIYGGLEWKGHDTAHVGVRAKIDIIAKGGSGQSGIRFHTIDTDDVLTEQVAIDHLGNIDIIAHDPGAGTGLHLGGVRVTATAAEINAGAGAGIITAAAALTDNRIVRGDVADTAIQTSGITIDDSDNVTFPASITLTAGGTTKWVAPGTNTLSAAVAAASSGDALYLMAGEYVQTEAITATNKFLSIIGSGPEVSVIKCTGCSGIISNYGGLKCLKDFTIKTTDAGGYNALTLSGASAPAVLKQYYVQNIYIRPNVPADDYWDAGIILIDAYHSVIIGCRVQGQDGGAFNATHGIFIDEATINCQIFATSIEHVEYAVFLTETVTPGGVSGSEGIQVTDCLLAFNNYGFYWDAPRSESHLSIKGCHFNSEIIGLYTDDVHWIDVTGNNFLKNGSQGYNAIICKNAEEVTITGNTVKGAADAAEGNNGIVFDAVTYGTVTGNTILDKLTDIWLKAGSNNNTVVGNTGNGSVHHIYDQGTNNLVIAKSGSGAQFGGDITVNSLAGSGNRYVYIDNDGLLKIGGAYP